MDASSLFGGGPFDVNANPPPPTGPRTDEPPRSAASLFGGEVEEETTTTLSGAPLHKGGAQMQRGAAPPVQDMPDDLFGGSPDGGGVHGFGMSSSPPGAATGFGGPPPPPRDNAPVPDGLFGGGSQNSDGPEALNFGGAIESSGFGAGGVRGDDRAAGRQRQANGTVGAGFDSGGDDSFGAPPASDRNGGFGGPSNAFPTSAPADTDAFGAPPSELFGGSPPETFAGPQPGAAAFGFSQGVGGDVFSGTAGGDGVSAPFGGPPRSGAAARSRPDAAAEAQGERRDGRGMNTAARYLPPSRASTPPATAGPYVPASRTATPPAAGPYLPPSRSATPPSTGQYLPPARSCTPPHSAGQHLPSARSSTPPQSAGQYLPPARSSTPPPSAGQYLPPTRSATPPPPSSGPYMPRRRPATPPTSGRGRPSREPDVFSAPRPTQSFGAPPADMFGGPPSAKGRRSSPPPGGAFGPQRSPDNTLGAPPANMFEATKPPPPRSLPPSSPPLDANSPFHPDPPVARSFGPRSSPPLRPTQPFGMPPKQSGGEWTHQTQPQHSDTTRSRHGSSSWGSQHSDSAAARSPEFRPARSPDTRPARKENGSLSRESSAASGSRAWASSGPPPPPAPPAAPAPQRPSTVASDLRSPPASMFGDAPRGDFGAPPAAPAPQRPSTVTAELGSPPASMFGGAPPASMFGGAPPGDFGAPSGDFGAPSGDFGDPPGDFGAPPGNFGASPGEFGAPPPSALAPAPPALSPRSCGSSSLAPFGTTYSRGDGAWRGAGVAVEGGGNEASRRAADIFGSPRKGDVFGGGGGEPALMPAGSGVPPSRTSRSSPGGGMGAAVASAAGGEGPEDQQRGPSGNGPALGLPALGGAFGSGGGTDDGSSPWWQTDNVNDDQLSMQVEPSEISRDDVSISADLTGSVTLSRALGGREHASSRSPLTLIAAAAKSSNTVSPPLSGGPAQELAAPPSNMFGPTAGNTRVVESEASLSQRQVPPPRSLRPQSPPQEFTTMEDVFAAPTAMFASPSQPTPGTVGVSLDNGREALRTAAVGADSASSGVFAAWPDAVRADARVEESVSPGWEKKPSPPLDLGVFGAPPPPDGKNAVVAGGGLFGEATGGDFTKDSGGYDEWGMCPADQDENAELEEPQVEPQASVDRSQADRSEAAVAPAVPRPPIGREMPPALVVPALKPGVRSSFLANKTSSGEVISFAGITIDTAPSSPPRLFAARSSSWTEGEMSIDEKSDYQDIFASSAGARLVGDAGFPTKEPDLSEGRAGLGEGKQEEEEEREDAEVAAGVAPEADGAMSVIPQAPPVGVQGLGAPSRLPGDDAQLQDDGRGGSTTSAQDEQPPLGDQPPLGGQPWQGDQPSKGDQPPQENDQSSLAVSGSSGMPGAAGLYDGAVDQTETLLPASGAAQSGDAGGGGKGESDVTQETGDKLAVESTLSTPFGTWSVGSGTRAGDEEGFPSAEIGDVLGGASSERPSSAGKKMPAGKSLSSSVLPRVKNVFPPIIASTEGAVAVGEQAGQQEDGVRVSQASKMEGKIEGKEDEHPRWDASAAASVAEVVEVEAAAAIAPPIVTQSQKKLDVDGDWKEAGGVPSADVRKEDAEEGGSVSNADGQKEDADGEAKGFVVTAQEEDERAVGEKGAAGEGHGREVGANLFSSESSNETRGDETELVRRQVAGDEDKRDRVKEEEEVVGQAEEKETEGEDQSESSNGLEASVAETTASDFFAVRAVAVFFSSGVPSSLLELQNNIPHCFQVICPQGRGCSSEDT